MARRAGAATAASSAAPVTGATGRRSALAPRRSPRPSPFVSSWQPRERPLVTLDDQGSPKALSPSLFGVGGRDRSWNAHAENFLSANRPGLEALAVQPRLVPGISEIGLELRPGGVVGAVPLRAPDTRRVAGGIVVRPRFGWGGVGQLLQEIGWSASPTLLEMPLVSGAAREVPPWVLAGPILQRLGRLLQDVKRDFRLVEQVRQSPRGQVLWARYVGEQMARGAFHQLPCRFPELGPDALLRAYLRWGIERVYRSLIPFGAVDVVARQLAGVAEGLLFELRDVPVRAPDRHTMDRIVGMAMTGLPSEVLRRGLQVLGWIMDERGLAGTSESDGLAWSLPMHELFERWVEHLMRVWARGFGGEVRSGREAETVIPIQWSAPSSGPGNRFSAPSAGVLRSLGSLVPDLVVRHGDRVWVIDAKYKGHFEELDEERWAELAAEIQEDHRHDLHQVLAYAGLFHGATVTAALVYPMRLETWERLAATGRNVAAAAVTGGGREVRLALVGVPLEVRPTLSHVDLVAWMGSLAQ